MPGSREKFDAKAFLDTIGEGITSVDWRKDETVFLARGTSRCAILHPERQAQSHDGFGPR